MTGNDIKYLMASYTDFLNFVIHGTSRRVQCLLNSPFKFDDSHFKSVLSNTRLFRPLCQRKFLVIKFYQKVVTTVVLLFFICRPTAVANKIPSGVVYSFYRSIPFAKFFTMLDVTLMHIIKEIYEMIPSWFKKEVFVPLMVAVSALHALPFLIKRCPKKGMLFRSTHIKPLYT